MSEPPDPSELGRLIHLHEHRAKKQGMEPSKLPRPRKPRRDWRPTVGLGVAAVAITYALAPWSTLFPSVFPPPAPNYAGTVTHVRDGDTIEVNGKPIRIANLDCAELGTDEGAKAHHHMLNLAAGQNVECHLGGQMSYDRFVGTCRLIGGDDVGQIMVAAGMCGWWR